MQNNPFWKPFGNLTRFLQVPIPSDLTPESCFSTIKNTVRSRLVVSAFDPSTVEASTGRAPGIRHYRLKPPGQKDKRLLASLRPSLVGWPHKGTEKHSLRWTAVIVK